MNVQPDPASFDLDEFLARQERKSLLRFIVCGSVDHGKSTVIGRLLYEAGMLFADQLVALDHFNAIGVQLLAASERFRAKEAAIRKLEDEGGALALRAKTRRTLLLNTER